MGRRACRQAEAEERELPKQQQVIEEASSKQTTLTTNSNGCCSSLHRGGQWAPPRSTQVVQNASPEELTATAKWAGRQLPQKERRHQRLHKESPRAPPRSTQAPEELTAAVERTGRQLPCEGRRHRSMEARLQPEARPEGRPPPCGHPVRHLEAKPRFTFEGNLA